jgi:hypothetical protein
MQSRSVVAILGALAIASIATTATAQSAKRNTRAPVAIPFEVERAALRGDRNSVRLNDDATSIPAHRIREVPVVDGKMGEHVRLDGGVELYFPFGRVVSASIEFHPLRVMPTDPTKVEADPTYRSVASFDNALGEVCARDVDGAGPLELRRSGEAFSLVRTIPARVAGPSPSYRVVTVTETRWLDTDVKVQRLLTNCLSGKPTTVATEVKKPAPEKKAPEKKSETEGKKASTVAVKTE